jgi:hypothetical protein
LTTENILTWNIMKNYDNIYKLNLLVVSVLNEYDSEI